MMIAVSLVIDFISIEQAKKVGRLLPNNGRPCFAEDVATEDKIVFEAIQYIHEPDELKIRKSRFLASWYETVHSLNTLYNAMEKSGGQILFAYALGDADPLYCEDLGGIYFSRIGDELKQIDKETYENALPGYDAPWCRDDDKNLKQIIAHLMSRA